MTRADNTRYLAAASRARHDAARSRAEAAIEDLDRSQQAVSILTVASAAKVSRAWLYRQDDLRAAVMIRASTPPSTRTVSSKQPRGASVASLRERLDLSRAEITRLRSENDGLREELARLLGEQRTVR